MNQCSYDSPALQSPQALCRALRHSVYSRAATLQKAAEFSKGFFLAQVSVGIFWRFGTSDFVFRVQSRFRVSTWLHFPCSMSEYNLQKAASRRHRRHMFFPQRLCTCRKTWSFWKFRIGKLLEILEILAVAKVMSAGPEHYTTVRWCVRKPMVPPGGWLQQL